MKMIFDYILLLLLTPFKFWLKVKVEPEKPVEQLRLNADVPVVYVLSTESTTDLFVLRWQCALRGLPVPAVKSGSLPQGKKSGYIYLSKLGLLRRRRGNNAPPPLLDLLKTVRESKTLEVKVVPVTIIWGRDPGKHEQSLWKLIFTDDENAGFLRKFFIALVHARSVFMHYGKPISLREQAGSGMEIDQLAKKIRRVIRVHFQSQRVATLGPSLYDRSFVANAITRSKAIQAIIDQEEEKKPGSRKKLEEEAYKYVYEIAAEPKPSIIRGFEIMLRYVWLKIFKGVAIHNSERIRELHATREVVYLTCHRSHVDYLLLGYVLYVLGMTAPHTAAGLNLNFWPIGGFLRAGGAFFLRRSFRGNRLYTAVFNEYVHFLLNKGYTMNFFPEGGRSRTGRTLPAKTGLIAMVVHSVLRGASGKPVVLIPVYVGYDQVIEIGSYIKELSGGAKKKESFKNFLGIVRIFRRKYGKAYVNFGEPIELANYLKKDLGAWNGEHLHFDERPEWFASSVNKIAAETMSRINGSAVVSPVALAATAILSTPQKAMSEGDFHRFFSCGIEFIKMMKKYYPRMEMASYDPDQLIATALSEAPIQRFTYPGDDVLYINEIESVMLNYYRNNIVHVFVGVALVANQFIHSDELDKASVLKSALDLYPYIEREYYIGLNQEHFAALISDLIEKFIELDLLLLEGEKLRRPSVATEAFSILRHLGHTLGAVFERYCVAAALLKCRVGQSVDVSDFEKQCQVMSQRVSLLNGQLDPGNFDQVNFRAFLDISRRQGYLTMDESGAVTAKVEMEDFFKGLTRFLSRDILVAVQRSNAIGEL